jgi:hypothetical protein
MRRLGFAVLLMSMLVAACGRIITVPRTGGTTVPAGNMLIRFRTQGTLDFTNQRYVIVFNTSGNGQQPLAPSFSSFLNYSFELIFGGTNIAGASYALLQIFPNGTSSGYSQISIPVQTQFITNFNPNSNGIGNEFTFTFNRQWLNVPNPVATASPVPPVPPPSPGPTPTLAPGQSTLWNMAFFSADSTANIVLDSIGTNGVQDTSFIFQIDVTQVSDRVINKPFPPPIQVNPSSAQVIAIEVINSP